MTLKSRYRRGPPYSRHGGVALFLKAGRRAFSLSSPLLAAGLALHLCTDDQKYVLHQLRLLYPSRPLVPPIIRFWLRSPTHIARLSSDIYSGSFERFKASFVVPMNDNHDMTLTVFTHRCSSTILIFTGNFSLKMDSGSFNSNLKSLDQ